MSENLSESLQCPCVGATLDKLLQPALLAVLMDGPLHGYELTRRIAEIPGFLEQSPDISGIYRILKNLENRGLITSSWDTPEHGRPKRLVEITPHGKKCLQNWNLTLKNYSRSLDSLHKIVKKKLGRK